MLAASCTVCGSCLFCAPLLTPGEHSWCTLQDYIDPVSDLRLNYAEHSEGRPVWCPMADHGRLVVFMADEFPAGGN